VSRLATAALRLGLVEQLEDARAVRTARVRAAFLQVPRELFVAAFAESEGLEAVYSNRLIVTKRDRDGVPISSSSEPQIMAAMLEALQLEEGMRVLEIGTGSGYNAALLKSIVGRAGRVVTVDLDAELARAARRALRTGGYAARVVVGNGVEAYAPAAPYDRIVVTASTPRVPRAWLDQLREGGLLEVPLRLRAEGALAITTFQRSGEALVSTAVVPGRFMPLRGDPVAAPLPPPVLTMRSRLGSGRAVVTRLGGSSLARLSPGARDRVIAVAATRPRTRRLAVRAASWPLGLYLSLELPERAAVLRYADLAIGLVGRGGRSLAFLEGKWEGGDRPTPQRLLAYGEVDAEERLLSALDRWVSRGRPGSDRLRVRIRFSGEGSTISHRWASSASGVVPRTEAGHNRAARARSSKKGDSAA
jgi:protein-L-isoaspartate(D-aspartate) O-methyltransferase